MSTAELGDLGFRVVVDDFTPAEQRQHSSLRLTFAGEGWTLGGEPDETFGVVVPHLIEFARDGAARHWAPFADIASPTAVLDRAHSLGYGGRTPLLPTPHRWDVSCAMTRYSLSALFDYTNLGVDFAICVRGGRYETFIVREIDGRVRQHDVLIKHFDSAFNALANWYAAVEAAGHERQDGTAGTKSGSSDWVPTSSPAPSRR